MKYFLIHLNTRDGEHEYGENILTQARDRDEAQDNIKQTYTDPYHEGRQWEGNQLDLFDQILEIEYVDEIPAQEYDVLRKYLPIVKH
jgi:hypothetical protein